MTQADNAHYVNARLYTSEEVGYAQASEVALLVGELRRAVLAQKRACRYAPPTAQEWSEGYEAALGWVLFRIDGVLGVEA